MKFTQHDTDKLLELLQWRRDVRHFKRTPLSAEVIQTLVQAIDLAPSVGNSRPWRIVQIESADIRNNVIDNHIKANNLASEIYVDEKRREYQKLKLSGMKEAPLQLAVFTDTNPKQGHGLGRQTMPETLIYSTIIAIHQLWLVARTMNVGVGWVSILEETDINTTLNVDESWQFTAYLCIGYPEFEDIRPELHKAGWQENTGTQWLLR